MLATCPAALKRRASPGVRPETGYLTCLAPYDTNRLLNQSHSAIGEPFRHSLQRLAYFGFADFPNLYIRSEALDVYRCIGDDFRLFISTPTIPRLLAAARITSTHRMDNVGHRRSKYQAIFPQAKPLDTTLNRASNRIFRLRCPALRGTTLHPIEQVGAVSGRPS